MGTLENKLKFLPIYHTIALRVETMVFNPVSLREGFSGGSAGTETACNAGDLGSIPGLVGSPGEGKGYPLQYSGLENSMTV